MQQLAPDALAYPRKDGVLVKDPLTLLMTQAKTEGADPVYLGGEFPDQLVPYQPGAITMTYPTGHDLGMQFLTYYRNNAAGDTGYLWYANDETMKMKLFRFRALTLSTFELSFLHYNDNVCSSYSSSSYTAGVDKWCKSDNDEETPDFGPLPYELKHVSFTFQNPGDQIKGGWAGAAKYYRNWVRNSDAPWVQHAPLALRSDDFVDFYRYTGFAVYNAGAEFALANPKHDTGNEGDNFLKAYHDLLFQTPSTSDPPAMVNYVLGWDFHHREKADGAWASRDCNYQSGMCSDSDSSCQAPFSDWAATIGPIDEDYYGTQDRMNRDAILGVSGSDPLGYLNPFLFGLSMRVGGGLEWREWEEEFGQTAVTPWMGHRNYPSAAGCDSHDADKQVCPMDPTDTSFYDYWVARNDEMVSNPYRVGSPGVDDAISGLYQDIGVTFAVQSAYTTHGGTAVVKPHHSGSALAEGFRVGNGGFVWEAQRQMALESRYDDPEAREGQQFLLGTEQMTELFIDSFDFYHQGAHGLGPIRPYTSLDCQCGNPAFRRLDKWIMEGDAREIPMLQMVYHPLMPVRHGMVELAGGEDSTYDMGDIFYWIVAREYFEYGNIVELEYHDVEMDVLSDRGDDDSYLPQMDTDTPSYRLGWGRANADSEHLMIGAPQSPGKHPYYSSERSVGDPQKELYLRLAAGIRSYVVPDFLVFGEMRPQGIFSYGSVAGAFDYYHFGQRGLSFSCQSTGETVFCPDQDWEHCSDMGLFPEHCENETAAFPDQRVIFGSWENYGVMTERRILHIAANLYNQTQSFTFILSPISEFTNPAYYKVFVMNPRTQTLTASDPDSGKWSAGFNPAAAKTVTVSSVPAHGVVLILVCDTQNCQYN